MCCFKLSLIMRGKKWTRTCQATAMAFTTKYEPSQCIQIFHETALLH